MRVALNRVFCFYLRVFWFLNNAATDRTHTIFDKTRETLYTPASSARFVTYRMFVKPSFFLNLPGWRWGSITQNPLVAVSRPLHSGVCETRQDIGLPVLHSEISDSGLLRTRGDQQRKMKKEKGWNSQYSVSRIFSFSWSLLFCHVFCLIISTFCQESACLRRQRHPCFFLFLLVFV